MKKTITLLTLLLLIASMSYAQKANEELWAEIEEALKTENYDDAKGKCRELILSTEPFDDTAVMCRYVLASLALNSDNMWDIYESYAFYRYFNENQKANDATRDMEKKLLDKYDALYEEDIQKPLTEGIYFSDYNDKIIHRPLAVAEIKANDDKTAWTLDMLDFCDIMDSKKNKKRGGMNMSAEIMLTENNRFMANWSGSVRESAPNTELAHSAVEEGQKFKAESYRTIAEYRPDFGEAMAATAFTEIFGSVFNLMGNAFKKGKSSKMDNELLWTPLGKGDLAATFTTTKVSMHTGDYDAKTKKDSKTFFMYKIYPHYEIVIADYWEKRIITGDGKIYYLKNKNDMSYLEKFSPIAFNDTILKSIKANGPCDLKNFKDGEAINELMYKWFQYNTLFASLKDSPMEKYVIPFDDMESIYFDNGAFAMGGKWLGKKKGFGSFFASRTSENVITYNEVPKDESMKYHRAVYYMNGEQVYGEYLGEDQNGYFKKKYTDGSIYQGYGYSKIKDGEGLERNPDGSEFEGTFENDMRKEGTLRFTTDNYVYFRNMEDGNWIDEGRIEYNDGSVYKGEINDKYQPNGKGELTDKNGKTTNGTWKDGVYQKPKTQSKTKTKTKTKNRKRK